MAEVIPKPMSSGTTDYPGAPQGGDDSVYVTGPDRKVYKFPKGTDKAAAIGYFKKKGIVGAPRPTTQLATAQAQPVPAPTAPAKPPDTSIAGRVEPYRAAVRQGVTEGVKGIISYPFQAAQLRPGEGEGRRDIGPTGRFLLHSGEDVLGALSAGAEARRKAAASGEGFAGQTMATLENWPFVGDIARAYEKSGGKLDPNTLKELVKTETYFVGPKMAGEAIGTVVRSKPVIAGLRKYATSLDTLVLKNADADAKDFRKADSLQMANEGIIGKIRTIPDKIERVRAAKDAAVKQSVAAAEQAGVTIDVSKDINPIVGNTMRVLNQRGQITSGVVAQVQALMRQVTQEVDPQASAAAGKPVFKPLNLTKLTPSKALALIKGLEDPANFGQNTPTEVENLARQLRGALNDRVGQRLPDVQKLRAEESRLIRDRDSARKNYEAVLNDKYKMINGIIYGNVKYIPLWLALKESGLGFGAATGGIILLKALWDNAPSRTTRAALAAKLANMLERSKAALQAPQGPQPPSAGGSAITRPNAPTAPPSAPNAALTAPPAQLPAGAPPSAAPVGSPTGGVTVSNPQWAGTSAGSVMGAGGDPLTQAAMAQAIKETGGYKSGVTGARAKAIYDEMKAAQSGAQSTTSSPAPGAETDFELEKRLGTTKPPEPVKPKATPSKLGSPEEIEKIKKSQAKFEKNKAMMDRFDKLLERQANPKSPMDNAAIQREIAEIKRVLTGEAKGPELAKINKHIADRERLAAKRSEAAAQQTGGGATAGGEAVAQGASPEDRMIKLDLGYKALAKFDGGPEMVKALQKLAKDMQRVDPNYDELEKLKEAILLLHQVEGQ